MPDLKILRLSSRESDFDVRLVRLLSIDAARDESIESTVNGILADVQARGDAALLEYTRRFDKVDARSASELEIPLDAARAALESLSPDLVASLREASGRIRDFHERQVAKSWEYTDADGSVLGQRVTPLDRVGIYVPGGRAAYPSSVLMNAVPAKVAGVPEVVMVVPTPGGERNAMVLAAAALAGVDRIFAIGGAQAIGALAYGTSSVPAVDKIVGPGNAYVAAAKRKVFGVVGIDMIAGPSEILVVCDGKTNPDWIAMDLFSQAEHDELAQSILLCPDRSFLDAVAASMTRLVVDMPRKEIICSSISGRGALIEVADLAEACDIVNRIAPEHLELSVSDPEKWLPAIRHAGAIFLGPYTSEALGDYCAGPNHVLPTSRTARFSSPLGVYDFQKRSSIIKVSQRGAQKLGVIASRIADGEGLAAHAAAARLRLGQS